MTGLEAGSNRIRTTSMISRPFLDTNIIVYAYTLDDARNVRALTLLSQGGLVSVQVLNEFVDVARRKLRFDWDKIALALSDLQRLLETPAALTFAIHQHAIRVSRQHGLRIYDSLLISAARAAGCDALYSEDMQHGRLIDGVRIINPFTPAA